MKQTQEELNQHLEEQIQFLLSSVKLFDEGNLSEAKRLASVLRTLFHNHGRSRSLFDQLGMKEKLFLDTSVKVHPKNVFPEARLTQDFLGKKEAKTLPLLDDIQNEHRMIDFESWWDGAIFKDTNGQLISRNEIVNSLSDKDGGGHVDPEVTGKYADLSRRNSMGRFLGKQGSFTPIKGLELYAVRQIAHEVLKVMVPDYSAKNEVQDDGFLLAGGQLITEPMGSAELHKFNKAKPKIGRNEKCPCGSGKKYKKCCGR